MAPPAVSMRRHVRLTDGEETLGFEACNRRESACGKMVFKERVSTWQVSFILSALWKLLSVYIRRPASSGLHLAADIDPVSHCANHSKSRDVAYDVRWRRRNLHKCSDFGQSIASSYGFARSNLKIGG